MVGRRASSDPRGKFSGRMARFLSWRWVKVWGRRNYFSGRGLSFRKVICITGRFHSYCCCSNSIWLVYEGIIQNILSHVSGTEKDFVEDIAREGYLLEKGQRFAYGHGVSGCK